MVPREEAAAEWLRLADVDRQAMEMFAAGGLPPSVAVFHAHQWVEKMLKAMLVRRGRDPARTHDLVFLIETLGDRVGEDVVGAARSLTPYAVAARYPGLGAEPDGQRCRHLIECARVVVGRAESLSQG